MWTGQGVEGQISPIHDTPSVATLTHTQTYPGTHTWTYVRGTFPAFGLWRIWESSTSGALTFHCEVKGGGGVCVEGGV